VGGKREGRPSLQHTVPLGKKRGSKPVWGRPVLDGKITKEKDPKRKRTYTQTTAKRYWG